MGDGAGGGPHKEQSAEEKLGFSSWDVIFQLQAEGRRWVEN